MASCSIVASGTLKLADYVIECVGEAAHKKLISPGPIMQTDNRSKKSTKSKPAVPGARIKINPTHKPVIAERVDAGETPET